MVRLLSETFRSVKCPIANPSPKIERSNSTSNSRSWCVYLILSTNHPIKTYVGVTNNFSRRLRQHNGEIKGGAKASRAGRPWVCACIIQGFEDHSEACQFETKWKSMSRKMPRKKKSDEVEKEVDSGSNLLLQRRQAALNRVKGLLDCEHLSFDWKLNPSWQTGANPANDVVIL